MTDHYEVREIKEPAKPAQTIEKKVFVQTTCDWCGAITKNEKGPTKLALGSGITDDERVTVEFVVLSGTGIYLSGEGWRVEDLCRLCVDRLKKLLEEQGMKISPYDF